MKGQRGRCLADSRRGILTLVLKGDERKGIVQLKNVEEGVWQISDGAKGAGVVLLLHGGMEGLKVM